MNVRAGLARRSVGAWGLWFFAVAASAPLTGLVGGVVTTFSTTSVVGVGLAFLVLTGALGLLAVGYVGMARHIGHAAPFYALLGKGLGRPSGMAGATVALLAYNAVEIALFGLIGGFLGGVFGGPWWVWAAAVWAVIFLLGLLRVDIGAGVLAVLLVLEIGVVAVFVVAGFTHPAEGRISVAALLPDRLLVDGVGGVFALSAAAFMGFESAPSFGEEARTSRSAGRATFAALLFLGPLFALASWALVNAAGPEQVAARAGQDPTLPLTVIGDSFDVLGPPVAALGSVLLVTSIVASMLSFHSAVARYLFALGRERVLPPWLAHTGTGRAARRDAPVHGSVIQSIIAALVVAVFALVGADPVSVLFTWLAAIAAVALLVLLVATSAAALRWFYHGGGTNESAWTRAVAPILGLVIGMLVLGSTVYNLGALLGLADGSVEQFVVPAIVLLAVVGGLVWAAVLSARRPELYAGIGDGRPHPLAVPDQRLSGVTL